VGDSLRAKLVMLQWIKMPPHVVVKTFKDREDDNEDLRINAVEMPFSQPFFIGMICALRKQEEKETMAKAAKAKPDKLKEERDEAVAKVTARGGKLIAAAHSVLLARLSDQESLAAAATEAERTRVEQAIEAVRTTTHTHTSACAHHPAPHCTARQQRSLRPAH
jgi:hypothetical protein